jgi:hypothetical protein
MLRRRREAMGDDIEAVFPDSLGGWRDPSNVRRVWREVRDELELEGMFDDESGPKAVPDLDRKTPGKGSQPT